MTIVINILYNKLYGPGCSTRHLHQNNYGGEIGSTCVIKIKLLLGIVPPISGYLIVANDNYAPVAAAA